MSNTENFVTVVELRKQLDEIIALNPNAKLVADVDGQDFVVAQSFNSFKGVLDADGDAHISFRSYSTGADAKLKELV